MIKIKMAASIDTAILFSKDYSSYLLTTKRSLIRAFLPVSLRR